MQELTLTDGKKVTFDLKAGDDVEKFLAKTGIDLLEPDKHEEDIKRMGTDHRYARTIFEAIYDGDAKEVIDKTTPLQLRDAVVNEITNFIQGVDSVLSMKLQEVETATQEAMGVLKTKLTEAREIYVRGATEEMDKNLGELEPKIRKAIATGMMPNQSPTENSSTKSAAISASTSTR